jgi:O-antigen/teichoic acid export membrane protein
MDAPAEPAAEPAARPGSRERTRSHVRGSSLLLAGRFVSLGVNFLVQIVVVRYLTKFDFSAYAYALSLVALGQSVITFGLDRAITRFIPIYEERDEYGKVLGTIVMVVGTIVTLGVLLVALAFGLRSLIHGSLVDDERKLDLILLLIALAPVQALDAVQTGLFSVFSKPRAIFFRKYVLAPAFRLAVVGVVVLGGLSVRALAIGTVVAGAAGVLLYAYLLLGEMRRRGLLERFRSSSLSMPWREVFTFTIPLLSSDLLYTVMNTTDAIMLEHFGDPTDVGAFRVIGPTAQMNQIVLASFSLLFTPMAARLFARGDREGINDVYWGTAIWTAVVSFPIFALTFSLAQPLTVTLFEERYSSSATYLALLSFGYFFQAALGFNGLTLKVCGLLRYIVTINVLAMLANLALNLALIPRYGPLGAAVGTTGTLVVHNLLKQHGLRRAGVKVFERRYASVYVSIVAGAASLLVIQLLVSPPFSAGFALAAAVSLLVVAVNRRPLLVGQTFPELMRFRIVRAFFGG